MEAVSALREMRFRRMTRGVRQCFIIIKDQRKSGPSPHKIRSGE